MDTIIDRIKSSVQPSLDDYEKRVANGDLIWSVNWTQLAIANVAYFFILTFLYLYFRNRDKLNPTGLMRIYNLSCVTFASMSAVGCVYYHINYPLAFVGNKGRLNMEGSTIIQYTVACFYFQKFWEFLDTFIFLVRKSYRQVTFLHVYHHSSITLVVAMYAMFDTSGDTLLAVFLNSFVHVLMYGHYFLSSIGIKNAPWKAYLTSLQLIQFLLIAAQSFMAWNYGPDRGFPDWMKATMIFYMITMLTLFGNFFVKSYMTPKSPKKATKAE